MKKNTQGIDTSSAELLRAKNAMASKKHNLVIQLDELKKTLTKRNPLDPTRYGDWEKKGRCIDF